MTEKETSLLTSRRKRIQKLKETIEQSPETPLSETIAKFCIEQGTREQTALVYYHLLVQAKEITPREPQKP